VIASSACAQVGVGRSHGSFVSWPNSAHLGVGVLETLPDDLATELLASYPQAAILPATHRLARRRRLRP
jgi:hypothetical protein